MRSISRIVVATAVAGACGYVSAATIGGATTTPYGLESAKMASQSASLTFTGLDGTANNSGLIIGTSAISTGQRLSLSSNVAFGSVDAQTATFTCGAGLAVNTATTVFTIASGASSSSAIVYDVARVDGTTSLNGASCAIPSIAFSVASLGAQASNTNITLSALITSVNTGATIDSASATKLASVANVFSYAPTPFDGVIDVASGRQTFTSASAGLVGTRAMDTWSAATTMAAHTTVGGNYTGVTFKLSFTSSASFSWLQEPGTISGSTTCSAGTGAGQATAYNGSAAGSILLSPTSGACTTLTASWLDPGTYGSATYTVGLGRDDVNKAASVSSPYAPTTYTASYVIEKGSATLTGASGTLSGGAWTQNGTTASLQYVPLGSTSTLQVFIANTSSVAGEATFVAYNDAGATCTGTLGTVTATGITSVGGTLRSLLLGAATVGTATSNCSTTFASAGRAAVTVTSTTPSASTRVHSAFSVADTTSRAVIVNSTN